MKPCVEVQGLRLPLPCNHPVVNGLGKSDGGLGSPVDRQHSLQHKPAIHLTRGNLEWQHFYFALLSFLFPHLRSGTVLVMFVELLQLLPDPFVLLSDKAVLSSSKAPNVMCFQDRIVLFSIVYMPV